MPHSELRKIRRQLQPYIEIIVPIGGLTTQTIFDAVFEESASLESDEDDAWVQRFLERMAIEELISNQEPAKMSLSVTVNHQELVRIMAMTLAQRLKMRSLVVEGYSSRLMSDFVFAQFVEIAVNADDVDFALMAWGVLEQLALKFGASERQLAKVFAVVQQEVSESRDPSYAVFVLISTLGGRRIEKLLLKKIVSDDDDNSAWWVV